ncbi:MAG: AAA family ATPase [Proteobacteria bacterium]|nr:AAA family ATPase [Pseudomonadota bacterium]
MIEKFISIKNVGKFADYSASGDTTFRKLTLIYGENGGGKTTLTNILRCLQADDPTLLTQRKTLGGTGTLGATILISGSPSKFQTTGWTTKFSDFAIYDATFVAENVHSGEEVEHEHRKNLHRLAIGEAGVKLAEEIGAIDGESRKLSSELRDLESDIRMLSFVSGVESFAALQPLADAAAVSAATNRIQVLKTEIQRVSEIDSIKQKPSPAELTIPQLPIADTESLLGRTLENVSSDAEKKVRDHLAINLSQSGEEWLSVGYHLHHKSDGCPFCAQSLAASPVFEAYKTFFSETYAQLKADISEQENMLHSVKALDPLSNLELNVARVDAWAKLLELNLPKLDAAAVGKAHAEALSALKAELQRKADDPLKVVEFTTTEKAAITAYSATTTTLENYNAAVKVCVQAITDFKARLEKADATKLRIELSQKELAVKRSEPAVDKLCKKYTPKVAAKAALQKRKDKAKEALKANTTKVIEQFQSGINTYLKQFGAGFEIIKTKEEYPAGQLCLDYQLKINNVPVAVSAPKGNPNVPCFKTCLSSGDKSALAFAFFLARLDADSKLADKVIIFDDPMTSLDAKRETRTCQNIVRLASQAKQVIVLSHEAYFLREIWELVAGDQTKTLQVVRQGREDSGVAEWNIEAETSGDYYRNYYTLEDYLEGKFVGDLRDVARCIRPILEANLRIRFPGAFPRNKWLGGFLEAIRTATPPNLLVKMLPFLNELTDINSFSKHFHHDQNPIGANTHPITDGELKPFVETTIRIISGVFSK